MGGHITGSVWEGFGEVLHVECNGWDWWWYVEEWQWRGWES